MAHEQRPTPRSVLQVEMGERLRYGRIALGMSQSELADAMERESKSEVSDLERGVYALNPLDVVRLNDLGLTPQYLFLNQLVGLDPTTKQRVIQARKRRLTRVPPEWKPNH